MQELKGILKDTQKHLMSGVSHMLPFVVAGGLLLAISVMLYGQGSVPEESTHKFLYDVSQIGINGMSLMVPILAAYIGFSIADRPAIAPSATAAVIGNNMGAGFIGGLAAGFLGGIVVYYLKKIKLPKSLASLLTIIIIPVIGTFITGGIMLWGIGGPITQLTESLTVFLNSLSGGSIVILAIIMSSMIAFDMGGPVNKVAFAFMVMGAADGSYQIVAIGCVAIAVPPLACALATILGPKKFTNEEREAGKASLLMGLIGISEGAIPFAAADPLKVIPSIMVGSAVGGSIAALMGVTSTVAWGGLIILPATTNMLGFVIALAVGSLVGAILMVTMKKVKIDDNYGEIEEDNFDLDIDIEIM